ncbi:MAG: diguanylate cyclase [Gemmatimonadota bacterium]|nr:diguanylate cyclase [Gemmatimonadota bacterium]
MEYGVEKFFDLTPELLCVTGTDHHFRRVNPAFERTLGWPVSVLLDHTLLDFVHPHDLDGTVAQLRTLRDRGASIEFENRYRCADGSYRQLAWHAYAEPTAQLHYAMAHDMTEAALDREQLHTAIEASPMAMILVDQQGTIEFMNHVAEELFGYTRAELTGRAIELLVPDAHRARHATLREEFHRAPSARLMGARRDLVARRRDGTEISVEIGLNPIHTAHETLVLSAIVDLTERNLAARRIAEQARQLKEANARLTEIAATDGLTGVWNRRAFLHQLEIQMQFALRTSRPLSLLMVDVDWFKAFNDEFGHLAGDAVLRQFAAVLRQQARRSDYVARIGGEEFAVILPETDRGGAIQLGERFRQAIERQVWSRRAITASIGATTTRTAVDQRELAPDWRSELLTSADQALYASKTRGRNRLSHADDLHAPPPDGQTPA